MHMCVHQNLLLICVFLNCLFVICDLWFVKFTMTMKIMNLELSPRRSFYGVSEMATHKSRPNWKEGQVVFQEFAHIKASVNKLASNNFNHNIMHSTLLSLLALGSCIWMQCSIAEAQTKPQLPHFDLTRLFGGRSSEPLITLLDRNLPEVQQMIERTKKSCLNQLKMPAAQRSLIREPNPTEKEKCLLECVLKGIKIVSEWATQGNDSHSQLFCRWTTAPTSWIWAVWSSWPAWSPRTTRWPSRWAAASPKAAIEQLPHRSRARRRISWTNALAGNWNAIVSSLTGEPQ